VLADYLLVKLGIDASSVRAALSKTSAAIAQWVDATATNMQRRVVAYIQRFIAVVIVINFLRKVRQELERLAETSREAFRLGVTPNELRIFDALGTSIGIANDKMREFIEKFKQSETGITNTTEAIRKFMDEIRGMPVEEQQARILAKTGQFLTEAQIEQMRAALAGMAPPRISLKQEMAISWMAYRSWLKSAWAKLTGGAYAPSVEELAAREALTTRAAPVLSLLNIGRRPWREVVEESGHAKFYREALDRLTGATFRRAEQIKKEEEDQKRRLEMLRELMATDERIASIKKQEAQLLEDYAAAERIMVERRKRLQNMMREMPEEDRIKIALELMQLDVEYLDLQKRRNDQERKLQEQRQQLEEQYNSRLQRLARELADREYAIDVEKRQRESAKYADVEMLARMRGSPVRGLAMMEQWLLWAAPRLRALGRFRESDIAFERAMAIEDRLRKLGFIRPDITMEKLSREAAKIRERMDALSQEAASKGIKVRVELED